MTAVRLRGNDYTQRAIEVHRRNVEGETLTQLAEDYDASHEAIRLWVREGRRHDLPPLDDRQTWLQNLTAELATRLPDADDGDAQRLAKQIGEWLGLAHVDRQRDAMLLIEAEKLSMLRELAERLGVADDPAVVKALEIG